MAVNKAVEAISNETFTAQYDNRTLDVAVSTANTAGDYCKCPSILFYLKSMKEKNLI